jgi:hypothetical protein
MNGVPVYDQRGAPYTRVWDGDGSGGNRIDIGAVEVQTFPLPSAVYGDYNADGVVDSSDYLLWRMTTGTTVTPYTGADGSGNGIVGPEDYDVWRVHYGDIVAFPTDFATASSASLASEPLTLAPSGNFVSQPVAMPALTVEQPTTVAPKTPFDFWRSTDTAKHARTLSPSKPTAIEPTHADALLAWLTPHGSIRAALSAEFDAALTDSADNASHHCEALDAAIASGIRTSM